MVWEVQLTAPEGAEEACSDILTAAGSQGSVMEWLPEDNAPVRVKGFFPDDIHHEQVKLHLLLLFAASSLAIPFETIHWRHIPDQDWTESWKKEIRPFPVGHRFLIRPSWWPPEDSDRFVLTIDPGLAFGSGSHETTSGCLEAIEWVRQQNNLGPFLDMGCGSGILAMGAAHLGAAPITACDLDPQAITTASENFQANDIQNITTILSDTVPKGPFHTIVANILSGVLLEMADDLVRELHPGGWLILAGLLDHQAHEIRSAYLARNLVEKKQWNKPPWVILALQSHPATITQ